jgi:galactoside O-acetyltransferase
MLNRLFQIYDKLFYDPYRFVRKKPYVIINKNTILLKSCRFQIQQSNRVEIGHDSMIGCSFIFESDKGEICVGNNSYVSGGTTLISRSKITIGDNVTIAWGCTIYDHDSHSLNYQERINDIKQQNEDYRKGRNFIQNKDWSVVKSAPVIIQSNAWIGMNSIILKGVTIGEGAVVGAGSVVRNNVPPWTIVIGNPAITVKQIAKEPSKQE